MAIQLVIAGCCGRMGSRIAALALGDADVTLSGALETKGQPGIGEDIGVRIGLPAAGVRISDDADTAIGAGEVLIEFTTPAATLAHVQVAQRLKKPVVIGTTGLSQAQEAAIRNATSQIPIVLSPNMSVGVNLLFELVQTASRRLGPSYDVEVVEAHHRGKQDAPSGTAKKLAALIEAIRRAPGQSVPVHAIRAGDIIGDHTVVFAGPSERIELVHRAQSRDAFAQGALHAAKFVRGRQPGLYDMGHVLESLTNGR